MNHARFTQLGLSFIVIFVLMGSYAFAQKKQGLQVALQHLQNNYKELGLTKEDVRDYTISDHYSTKHNGLTHVYLIQRVNGIDVHNAMININVLPNGKILNINNDFIQTIKQRVNTVQASITPEDAVQSLINHFDIFPNEPLRLKEQIDEQHFVFDKEGIALQDIPVHLVYQPMEDKTVKLAWNVKLYTLDAQNWYNVRIDATNGDILNVFNQVIHCDFGTPGATCDLEDHNHALDHSRPAKRVVKKKAKKKIQKSPSMMTNSYNVYPMPVESPNHGDRELLTDPANPFASPFGWHDTNGEDGAEYTITRGNNVHAYQDINNSNGSSNDEPDGGANLDFDFPIGDITQPYTNIDAAVTNLFYWSNTMHDLWYTYGFDEAAGNFQQNNYGNGGNGSDYVNAEALDGSGTNNANFATDVDGQNPRMQMYYWTTGAGGSDLELDVLEPTDVVGSYTMVPALFGNLILPEPIISEVVLVDDGTDPTSDACEDIINGDELTGKIAMIDRGTCEFGHKVLKAENEGAVAVIICNNVSNPATVNMAPGDEGDQVSIPSVMLSLSDCNVIKMGLPGLTVSLDLGGPVGNDGDFDSGIIAHEYTHGISIRLTGGPGQAGCLSGNEQAGEGWSDWFGIVMTTTEDMTPTQNRGVATYALGQGINGGGLRPYPYSTNMNVNPHTYADINFEAVPHGVGSVWCAMIWDLYWNLVEVYGFDSDFFEGTGGNNIAMQLVLDGLKLQGCNPSFIDARDAIIAADVANNDGVNVCLIWETFANRGLGASASAGGNEAFDLPDLCSFTLKINKTAVEMVNAGDVLTYTLEITNDYIDDLTNVEITDPLPDGTSYVTGSSSCGGEVIDGKLTFTIDELASGETLTCTFQVTTPNFPVAWLVFEDNMDNGNVGWETSNGIGNLNWVMDNSNPYGTGNFAWYGEDGEPQCDQYLEQMNPVTIDGDHPALVFWHYYDTETDWDGGVIEISTNGGNTWMDLGDDIIQNGYVGDIEVNPASAISGQPAFHGRSNGYIQTVVDLTPYTGQSIQVRFRMVCDEFVAADGWYIGQVRIYGNYVAITNEACADASSQETDCSSATTILLGNPTGVEDLTIEEIAIYPNPTDGILIINFAEELLANEVSISIYSTDGRLLRDESIENHGGITELNLSNFDAGVYLINIKTSEKSVIKKLIVE